MINTLQETLEQSLVGQFKQAKVVRKNSWIKIPHILFNENTIEHENKEMSLAKYIGFQGVYLYCMLASDTTTDKTNTTTIATLVEKYATKGFTQKRDFTNAIQRLYETRIIAIDKKCEDLKATTPFEYIVYNPKDKFERVNVGLLDLFRDNEKYDYRSLSLYIMLYRYHNTFQATDFQIAKGEFGYAFTSMNYMSTILGCSKKILVVLIGELECVYGTKHKRILNVYRNPKLVQTGDTIQKVANKYCCYPKADPQNHYYLKVVNAP